jgi:hypothetical protein
MEEFKKENGIMSDKDMLLKNLQIELEKYKINQIEMLQEVSILFPQFNNVSLGRHIANLDNNSAKIITVLLYEADNAVKNDEILKMEEWLSLKLKTKDIKIVRYKEEGLNDER